MTDFETLDDMLAWDPVETPRGTLRAYRLAWAVGPGSISGSNPSDVITDRGELKRIFDVLASATSHKEDPEEVRRKVDQHRLAKEPDEVVMTPDEVETWLAARQEAHRAYIEGLWPFKGHTMLVPPLNDVRMAVWLVFWLALWEQRPGERDSVQVQPVDVQNQLVDLADIYRRQTDRYKVIALKEKAYRIKERKAKQVLSAARSRSGKWGAAVRSAKANKAFARWAKVAAPMLAEGLSDNAIVRALRAGKPPCRLSERQIERHLKRLRQSLQPRS